MRIGDRGRWARRTWRQGTPVVGVAAEYSSDRSAPAASTCPGDARCEPRPALLDCSMHWRATSAHIAPSSFPSVPQMARLSTPVYHPCTRWRGCGAEDLRSITGETACLQPAFPG